MIKESSQSELIEEEIIIPFTSKTKHLTCGIPTILWHASICCITSGRDGAANTIFPARDRPNIPIKLEKPQRHRAKEKNKSG